MAFNPNIDIAGIELFLNTFKGRKDVYPEEYRTN